MRHKQFQEPALLFVQHPLCVRWDLREVAVVMRHKPPQERHRSLSPRARHRQPKHSTPSNNSDVTVQPNQETEEDIPSVALAAWNLPSQTPELYLMGGKEDVGEAGPTILLRARDVIEKNFGAIADFGKQLGAGVR